MKEQSPYSSNPDRYKRMQPTLHLSGAIENVVASLGIARNYHGWLVVANWSQIVGEQIDHVSEASRFEDGTLYVAVHKDTWRQELSMQKDSILDKIHSYPYGKAVRELRFVRGKKG